MKNFKNDEWISSSWKKVYVNNALSVLLAPNVGKSFLIITDSELKSKILNWNILHQTLFLPLLSWKPHGFCSTTFQKYRFTTNPACRPPSRADGSSLCTHRTQHVKRDIKLFPATGISHLYFINFQLKCKEIEW